MGAKLKNLSSREVVSIFVSFGFVVLSRKGSHIKLRRENKLGKETLIIPESKEIPKGTLKAIFKQGVLYVAQEKLRPHFYSE